jgi:hypothetical protein
MTISTTDTGDLPIYDADIADAGDSQQKSFIEFASNQFERATTNSSTEYKPPSLEPAKSDPPASSSSSSQESKVESDSIETQSSEVPTTSISRSEELARIGRIAASPSTKKTLASTFNSIKALKKADEESPRSETLLPASGHADVQSRQSQTSIDPQMGCNSTPIPLPPSTMSTEAARTDLQRAHAVMPRAAASAYRKACILSDFSATKLLVVLILGAALAMGVTHTSGIGFKFQQVVGELSK